MVRYEDGDYEYDEYFDILEHDEDCEPYVPPPPEPEAALFDARGNQLTTWESIGEGLEIPAPEVMGTYRAGIRREPWSQIMYDVRFINSLGGGDVVHVPKPEITIS